MTKIEKQALITGANRGIGQELARRLAIEGWKVLVAARDAKKGEAAAARLKKETAGKVRFIRIDVTDPASIAAARQKLKDGAVKLDALVNNAGIYGEREGDLGAERTIDTNFFGTLHVTDGLSELLVEGAHVVNVTSGLGALANLSPERRDELADPALTRKRLVAMMKDAASTNVKGWGTDCYGVSKAALNALTRILARELEPRKIKVNATCPGWVRTDMGGRNAPRTVEEGAASVFAGLSGDLSGRVLRDGRDVGF